MLDIKTFKQRMLLRLNDYTECVCLCNSPEEDLLTIGSRTSFAFFDTRTWERVGEEKLPRRIDEDPHSVQCKPCNGSFILGLAGWGIGGKICCRCWAGSIVFSPRHVIQLASRGIRGSGLQNF